MNCKYCGLPVEDGKKFCTNCGASVEDPIPQAAYSASSSIPSAPATLPSALGKNGMAKQKTLYFWISKGLIVLAMAMFFLPFMNIIANEKIPYLGTDGELIEMSGEELVFGTDSKFASGSMKSGNVQLAGIFLLIALLLPKGSQYFSCGAAFFLIYYARNAAKSYTFNKKAIADWKGALELNIKPAVYAAIILAIAAAILTLIDESKRKKEYKDILLGGGAL
ncbi:MAG: zinc ribbon domain-containing protein [Ruminococcus sp.]|nr:zinc ribbon domain-containing protein [Ruminococcus sp.]